MLDLGVADEAIKKNPAKSPIVQVPKWIGKKIIPWTDETLDFMIDSHPDHLRAIPVIGGGCGMRQGEIFGVALEDFDFAEGKLHVRRQVKKLGKDYVYAFPKNDKERTVPLPEWVSQTVRIHITKFKPRPLTLPWEQDRHAQRSLPLDGRQGDARPAVQRDDLAAGPCEGRDRA